LKYKVLFSMENQYQQDLHSIRQLMERSVKFVSLSGLSGILAGCYALAGAGLVYQLLPAPYDDFIGQNTRWSHLHLRLLAVPVGVLAVSVTSAWLLSHRKAKKAGMSLWTDSTRRMLGNFAVPLVAGGLFILISIGQGNIGLAAPASLLFYGLALVTASSNTFDEIRYLGYSNILLGLIASAWPAYGLLLWAAGFGLLHVLYGGLMHKKYER
jgi:hypothetical protein